MGCLCGGYLGGCFDLVGWSRCVIAIVIVIVIAIVIAIGKLTNLSVPKGLDAHSVDRIGESLGSFSQNNPKIFYNRFFGWGTLSQK